MMTFDTRRVTNPDFRSSDTQNIGVVSEFQRPSSKKATKLAHEAQTKLFLSNLMAAAGHDLRQPLQVISAILEVLEQGPSVKPPLKRALEAVAQLAGGLDRLAFAATLARGSDEPSITTFHVAELLRPLESMWRH